MLDDNGLPSQESAPLAGELRDCLVGVQDMARILNVPISWLYQRTRIGAIPFIRVGKYVRFDPVRVLAFFRAKSPDGNPVKDAVS